MWILCQNDRYLVGVSAAVAVHSLLQLLINVSRMFRKTPVVPCRNHAWLVFAGDQVINMMECKTETFSIDILCYIASSLALMMDIWMLLQIFAFAMMSAGSAASGVTNLNRTGIHHSELPNFCKPLQVFCNRVAVSIAFTFFSCLLLAISVVLDVIWLSKYWVLPFEQTYF